MADSADDLIIWYHGSPLRLDVLRVGSTITRDRRLAEMFSHRPTAVIRVQGRYRHDGRCLGHLYRIAEPIREPDDLYPHPRSSMPPGSEYLIRRPLRLQLIELVPVVEADLLPPELVAPLVKASRQLARRATRSAERGPADD